MANEPAQPDAPSKFEQIQDLLSLLGAVDSLMGELRWVLNGITDAADSLLASSDDTDPHDDDLDYARSEIEDLRKRLQDVLADAESAAKFLD